MRGLLQSLGRFGRVTLISWLAVRGILGSVWEFLKSIPWQVWAVVGILVLFWWWGGNRYEQGRLDLLAEQAKEAAKIEDAQEAVTERVVIEYRDRVQVIREKGDTIIKEVPVYVTVKDDSACTINNGFVRLWNDANKGEVSESPAGTDGAPSGVSLSDVATQKAIEAKLCRETEQQLISLQDWILQQQALWEEHR